MSANELPKVLVLQGQEVPRNTYGIGLAIQQVGKIGTPNEAMNGIGLGLCLICHELGMDSDQFDSLLLAIRKNFEVTEHIEVVEKRSDGEAH